MNKYIRIVFTTIIILSLVLVTLVIKNIWNPPLLGDVNNDGIIDETDLNMVHQHLLQAKELTENEKLRADMNQDGKVNALDMLRIHKYILANKGE